MTDPAWQESVRWGRPRPGHPEGSVLAHIGDVLGNVEAFYSVSSLCPTLRLIALLHDSFKHRQIPGGPGHGMLARRFAEAYIADHGVLDVIEWHDEAYKAWRLMMGDGDRAAAERRAAALIAALGTHLELFMAFYHCDVYTGDKTDEHYRWFAQRRAAFGPAK